MVTCRVAFDYPIMLDVSGVRVLVVGGGRVALRKIEGLLASGAHVTVVAPDVADAIRCLPVEVRSIRKGILCVWCWNRTATAFPTVATMDPQAV